MSTKRLSNVAQLGGIIIYVSENRIIPEI